MDGNKRFEVREKIKACLEAKRGIEKKRLDGEWNRKGIGLLELRGGMSYWGKRHR